MSSTNRGYDRHKSDFYVTPQQPIKEFINAFVKHENISEISKKLWLDPCAGGDERHAMSYPQAIQDMFNVYKFTTNDIRENSRAMLKKDYLSSGVFTGNDIIITNPPFHLAQQFIEKALSEVNNGGYVVMLLRLNFLGSAARFQFWKDHPATSIYVHHKRMSFTDDGKTDSIEYAHFVWHKTTGTPDPTRLYVI